MVSVKGPAFPERQPAWSASPRYPLPEPGLFGLSRLATPRPPPAAGWREPRAKLWKCQPVSRGPGCGALAGRAFTNCKKQDVPNSKRPKGHDDKQRPGLNVSVVVKSACRKHSQQIKRDCDVGHLLSPYGLAGSVPSSAARAPAPRRSFSAV